MIVAGGIKDLICNFGRTSPEHNEVKNKASEIDRSIFKECEEMRSMERKKERTNRNVQAFIENAHLIIR